MLEVGVPVEGVEGEEGQGEDDPRDLEQIIRDEKSKKLDSF